MAYLSFSQIGDIISNSPIYERHAVRNYLQAVSYGQGHPDSADFALEDAKRALAEYKKLTARPVVGQFANEQMYSDVSPWEIIAVSKSGKSMTVREMHAEIDPDGPRPEIAPGGFAGHCTNQREVKYICTPKPDGHTRTIRLSGRGWDKGRFSVSDRPVRFYDFNF